MIHIFEYYNRDIPICQSQIAYISKPNTNKRLQRDQRMSDTSRTSHTIADTECSGVFWMQMRETQPYHDAPNYMSCSGDYHLFAKNGDKVYMEVRNAGEIVISFVELQKNKFWKYYYDLSLMLANDKHKLIKNETFNKTYNQIYGYTEYRKWSGDRVWSLETAYIDQSDLKKIKIFPRGNVCYYKKNPFDLEKMEYSTPRELEVFEQGYMNGLVRVKWFSHRSVIYENIAMEYVMNENKKHIHNLTTLNSKYCMNDDILTKIYNMVSLGSKYEYIMSKNNALILAE